MNSLALRHVLLVGAVALGALALTTACGSGDSGMNHGDTQPVASAPGSAAAFNTADVQFAQMMIVHHRQAVEMATLAETRASDPEVKQLATAIKAAQGPEIALLTGWLASWEQPTAAASAGHNMPGTGSSMPGMLSDKEMSELKAAGGAEFDRLFAGGMITHHDGAITMAKDEQAKGANTEAKALAASIEKTQAAEVDILQKIVDRLQ